MQKLFEMDIKEGFLELYEAEGLLVLLNGFKKGARGVHMEIPDEEAADLAEAILRHLGAETAQSVFSSIISSKIRHE